MSFAHPLYLYLVPAILLTLGLLFWASERVRDSRLKRFAASKMIGLLTASASRPRRIFKMILIALAACLLAVAAARPQYGFTLEESEGRGLDIMFALDTSRSMLAEDVAPNRLDRSKLAILDLVDDLRGDEVGLIAFAGGAFLQCPLTLDYDAFRQTLDVTETGIIAQGGTDLGAAINEAREAFDGSEADKLLVLITDGEDLELRGLAAAREAAEKGIRIFTVGVGDAEGGLIPISDAQGNRDYVRDSNGMPVRSALDENALRAIASATEGIYVPLGASGAGLRQIYDQLRELFPEADQGTRIQQIPLERFQWPLGAAILLLLLEPLIAARRRFSGAPLAALALLGGLHLLSAPSIEASPQRALKLYQEGKYEDAARLYEAEVKKNPEDARLRYNYGTTLYRLGQWDEAHAQFTAALRTDDPDLQADAFYNRGNTQYQIGRETEDSVDGRRTKRAAWEAALEDYANALSLDPGAPQVQRNEQLLSRLLSSFLLRVRTAAIPEEAGTTEPTDGFFVPGETVSLEAQANEGWMFRRWESESVELEKPDSAKATFPVSMPTDLAGIFVKTWELEVLTANAEQGTAEKSGTYPEDEPTPIKAEAKDGFAFKSWEAEGTEVADPASPETTVQLTQNAVVTATFQDAFELTVQWSPAIGGTAGTSGWYPIYEDVPVKAEPREGFAWSGWLGEDIADASAPETTVTLNGDRTVTAVFDRLWNLIVAPQQEEQGTTTGSCDEPIGSTVSIAATPSEGYTFDHWEGPGVADPNAAETTVTIQSNEHDVIAVFQSDDQNQDENNDEQNQDQSQENQDQQNQNQSDSSENQNQEQDQSQSENEDSSESESEQSGEPEEQQDNGENTENSEEEPEQSPEEQAGEEKENGEDEPSEDTEEENAQEAGGTEAQPVERVPGQMTAEEARQLLNILRESEKKLPASRSERGESDNSTGRDW